MTTYHVIYGSKDTRTLAITSTKKLAKKIISILSEDLYEKDLFDIIRVNIEGVVDDLPSISNVRRD
jgi:flavodoxin